MHAPRKAAKGSEKAAKAEPFGALQREHWLPGAPRGPAGPAAPAPAAQLLPLHLRSSTSLRSATDAAHLPAILPTPGDPRPGALQSPVLALHILWQNQHTLSFSYHVYT